MYTDPRMSVVIEFTVHTVHTTNWSARPCVMQTALKSSKLLWYAWCDIFLLGIYVHHTGLSDIRVLSWKLTRQRLMYGHLVSRNKVGIAGHSVDASDKKAAV